MEEGALRDLAEYLRFAVDLSQQAGRIAMAHYQRGTRVELKADRSPVTAADRGAEQLIRNQIANRYPSHGVAGEEFGDDGRRGTHRWIVDPIDGTRSFVRGVPLFGVLIALEIDGAVAVGVCHLPALDETVAAARGMGCTWNGRAARVSHTQSLADAIVVYSDARLIAARLGPLWKDLQERTGLQRGWGDCYGHCLVATGRADIMLDPVMNLWDCAAFLPILEESGGRFTDWRGVARMDGGDAVATNAILHEEIVEVLARARP